jgi:phage tail-like protein
MAEEAQDLVKPPFMAFNFEVAITLQDGGGRDKPLCNAAFSECDGLEMNLTPKTIREGGNNHQPIHLLGPVTYGQLSLKRGMTDSFDLWTWFERVQKRERGALRATTLVTLKDHDGKRVRVSFKLTGCLPVKLKAPGMNAKDGLIAIEEMQIAYETLTVERPQDNANSGAPNRQ